MTLSHLLAVLAISLIAGMVPYHYGSKIAGVGVRVGLLLVIASVLLFTGVVGLLNHAVVHGFSQGCVALLYALIAGSSYLMSSCILSKPRRAGVVGR